ncbi:MAG: histidine--tRNA ligase [Candidatus Micrarchaeia archaeon]|jgi:histidyl-tRNA synthetase
MAEEAKLDLDSLSLKGFRDFLPAQKRKRDAVVQTLRECFGLYGFEPLETPALERLEVLSSKFAGGEEILKEIYSLEDQGGRKLALRYDLTVPLCRVMAENPRLPMPFKRYQIQPVWRDGPTKLGRYREFLQCDADVVGAKGVAAEAELLLLALCAFEKLGMGVEVRVSNRKFLNGLLDACGISPSQREGAILSLDKLEKIGVQGVEKELLQKGVPQDAAKKLISESSKTGANKALLDDFSKIVSSPEGAQGLAELSELFSLLGESSSAGGRLVFLASLARGLNYYTGTVFEVFLRNGGKISSSLAAGGRYDKLIGSFLGAKEDVPAVGISFGLDVICDALESEGKNSEAMPPARVFVIPIKTVAESLKIAEEFRRAGVATAMDLAEKNVGKNLEYAAKAGIPFAVLVGKNEVDKNVVTLRDLKTGEQSEVSVQEAAKRVSRQ